jgi:hypothetical protein
MHTFSWKFQCYKIKQGNTKVYRELKVKSYIVSLATCPLFRRNLFEVSGELELSGQLSNNSSSCWIDFSMEKLEDRRLLVFLVGSVLLPVMVDCADTLGVLTTKDERDLSFLLAGNGAEAATTSGSFTSLRFEGKTMYLRFSLLWSSLICGFK